MKMRDIAFRIIASGAIALFFVTADICAGADFIERLKPNIVRITVHFDDGGQRNGFGFIVSTLADSAYIVTARHNMRPADDSQPYDIKRISVNYFSVQDADFRGRYISVKGDLDIGVVKAEYPKNLAWTTASLASRSDTAQNTYVWFIGRNREWYTPPEKAPGTIEGTSGAGRNIEVMNLDVAPGTSGAPLFSRDGIIGMIIKDNAYDCRAINISVVCDALQESNIPWDLKRYKPRFIYARAGGGIGFARIDRDLEIFTPTREKGLYMTLGIGYSFIPGFSLGIENSLWYRKLEGLVYNYDVYALVGTLYIGDYFNVRAGPSLSIIKAEPAAIIEKETGVGLIAGIAAGVKLGHSLRLEPGLDFFYQSNKKFNSDCIAIALGLGWYWQ